MSPWSEVNRTIVFFSRSRSFERPHQPADLVVDGGDGRVVGGDLLRVRRCGTPAFQFGRIVSFCRVVEFHVLLGRRRRDRAAGPSTRTRKNGSLRLARRKSMATSVSASGSNLSLARPARASSRNQSGMEVVVAALVGGPEVEALPARSRRDEAGIALAAVEVPLADEAGLVALRLEELGQRRLRLAQPQVVGDHAVLVRVLPVSRMARAGTADGRVGEGLAEEDAFGRQPVDVRRLDIGVAHAAEGLAAQLVGNDEQDVRATAAASARAADSDADPPRPIRPRKKEESELEHDASPGEGPPPPI